MSIRESRAERAMNHAFVVILILLSALMLFPFINLLAKSVSGEAAVLTGSVYLLPKDFQLGTYEYVVNQPQFFNSFWNSLFITVVGTALAMVVNCLTAYPLSKTWIVGRKGLILFFVFTMLFSGGMVPSFLLIRSLDLMNTRWSVILSCLLSTYYVVLVTNFIRSLPGSLLESARLDGASEATILVRIVLPLSKPILATIALFYAVDKWNEWWNSMLYINRMEMYPLQLILQNIINTYQSATDRNIASADALNRLKTFSMGIKMAAIVVTMLPIMCVFPFLQRFFVKGIMIGAVKG